MAIQSQPSRISEPFAGSGTKNVIPAANSTPNASQAASWASGFPPECSQPISAGGCPVPRNDMNGVLNWLSQGFAFGQDGGIWEWSALADYDTQRMVRGSDGILYWSIAQSGPGFAAGAQDPTADTGVYWSTMPMLTPPLADDSSKAATTEWVRDLAVAPVFVDPAGSDSNDGMSAAAPVKTFAKAAEIGSALPGGKFRIEAAGGSYSGDLAIYNTDCVVELLGDVVFNGSISIRQGSVLRFFDNSSSFSLTINSSSAAILSNDHAAFFSYVPCIISADNANGYPAISSTINSFMHFTKPLNIHYTSTNDNPINITYSSIFMAEDSVEINGSGIHVAVVDSSSAFFARNAFDCSSFDSENGLQCSTNSSAVISGSAVYINSNNGTGLAALDGSYIDISNASSFTLDSKGTGTCIGVYDESYVHLTIKSGATFLIKSETATSTFGIFTSGNSFSYISGTGTLTIDGPYTYVTRTTYGGMMRIASGLTVGGTATGQRYDVYNNGVVFVENAGVNRIPGSSGGYVASNEISFYK